MLHVNNVKPTFYGGFTLPAKQFASINHITAFRVLNFTLRAKDVYLLL